MTSTLLWDDAPVVGGVPGEVRAVAATLSSYAEVLGQVRHRVNVVGAGLSAWRGAGAAACRARLAADADVLAQGSSAVDRAAAALESYAGLLDELLVEQTSARATWRRADEATARWGARASVVLGADATVHAAGADPGALDRGLARAVLGSAAERQRAGAALCRAVLDEVTGSLARTAAPRTVAELLSYAGRDARQGLASGVRGLLDSARSTAEALFDPAAGARDLAAGWAFALSHPLTVAKEQVRWADLTGGHPVRAVAEAVPGAVAGYATGGASKAAEIALHRPHRWPDHGRMWHLDAVPSPEPSEFLRDGQTLAAVASRIAVGHAWHKERHAEGLAALGVTGPLQLTGNVLRAMTHPTLWTTVAAGRMVFWDESQSLFVAYDPNNVDLGTAYVPDIGIREWYKAAADYIQGDRD